MAAISPLPAVTVRREPGPVLVDGRPVPVHPVSDLPLPRLHHLA